VCITFAIPNPIAETRVRMTRATFPATYNDKKGVQIMLTFIDKKKRKKVLMAVGIGLFALSGVLQPAQAQSCTYYVSPTGSDSNAGTLSAPWQTVQKAFNTATGGQTVCFRGGTSAFALT
jgi:hypothetical protein